MWFRSKSFIYLLPVVLCTTASSDAPEDQKTININIYTQDSPAQDCPKVNILQPLCDCGGDKWFVIQSTSGSLILDAVKSDKVILHSYTGNATQMWKFEPVTRPGTFYIVNKHDGNVLAVDDDEHEKPMRIIVEKKTGSLAQQWITNWNGRIRNVGTNLNLDVKAGKFEPGTVLIAWAENGDKAQEFKLEEKPN